MPNLQRANVLAVKLLLRQRITSLRTDPLHLDCSGQILVDSVQHYAECVGRSAEDFMAQSSRDCQAYAVYGRYLILYNREVLSSCRRRWSIAHELGHICCRHSCDGVREEAEANAFAASLLMPTAATGELIHRGRLRDAKDLCDIFGVSLQSAQLRMQQLERTGTQLTELEEQLRQRYLPVIEEYLAAPVITLPRSRLEPPPLLL